VKSIKIGSGTDVSWCISPLSTGVESMGLIMMIILMIMMVMKIYAISSLSFLQRATMLALQALY